MDLFYLMHFFKSCCISQPFSGQFVQLCSAFPTAFPYYCFAKQSAVLVESVHLAPSSTKSGLFVKGG